MYKVVEQSDTHCQQSLPTCNFVALKSGRKLYTLVSTGVPSKHTHTHTHTHTIFHYTDAMHLCMIRYYLFDYKTTTTYATRVTYKHTSTVKCTRKHIPRHRLQPDQTWSNVGPQHTPSKSKLWWWRLGKYQTLSSA